MLPFLFSTIMFKSQAYGRKTKTVEVKVDFE